MYNAETDIYLLGLKCTRTSESSWSFSILEMISAFIHVPVWESTTCAVQAVSACHCWEHAWGTAQTPAQASSLWHFWPSPALLLLLWSLSHPSEPNKDHFAVGGFQVRRRSHSTLYSHLHPFDSPDSPSSIVGSVYSGPFLLWRIIVFIILLGCDNNTQWCRDLN